MISSSNETSRTERLLLLAARLGAARTSHDVSATRALLERFHQTFGCCSAQVYISIRQVVHLLMTEGRAPLLWNAPEASEKTPSEQAFTALLGATAHQLTDEQDSRLSWLLPSSSQHRIKPILTQIVTYFEVAGCPIPHRVHKTPPPQTTSYYPVLQVYGPRTIYTSGSACTGSPQTASSFPVGSRK